MNIFNATPHSINIINRGTCRFASELRKWVSENPEILTSIPSNGMLSANIESTYEPNSSLSIPVFSKKIVGKDPIPAGYSVVIVSQLYMSACNELEKINLYTVADPVYSVDGRTILGSLGICKAF